MIRYFVWILIFCTQVEYIISMNHGCLIRLNYSCWTSTNIAICLRNWASLGNLCDKSFNEISLSKLWNSLFIMDSWLWFRLIHSTQIKFGELSYLPSLEYQCKNCIFTAQIQSYLLQHFKFISGENRKIEYF